MVQICSHQSHLETPTPISSLPFLKSDCKPATRLLLNYSLKSDVWAVNHVRFHTDRRGVQVLLPPADWAQFTHPGEEPSHYAVSLAGPQSQWAPCGDQRAYLFSVPSAAFLLCNLVLIPPFVSEGLGNWKTPFSLCISRT